MSIVSVDCILTRLCVIFRCFVACNILGLCLFRYPISIKYCSVGCYLRCDTRCHRGNFRRGIHRLSFSVSTATSMGSGTFRIIRIPDNCNFAIRDVTGCGNRSVGISIITYRAGMGSITVNRTCRRGYYIIILMTGSICFSIGISISAYRAGMCGITIIRTGGSGYDGIVLMSIFGDICNFLCLFVCPILREGSCVGGDTLLRTGGRSLFCAGNSSGCSLDIIAVTDSACGARLAVFAPGIVRFTIYVRGYICLTADVTVVILIPGLIGAVFHNGTTAVITDVITVGCGVGV